MTRALTGILAAAGCVILAGCGVQGQAYQRRAVPASQSLIYIYRPYTVLSSQASPTVTCGHETIELDGGGFDEFLEDSGTVTCTTTADTTAELKFEARADERYFIREDVDSSGLGTQVRFKLMNAAVGEDEIKECSREGIKE